MTIWAFKSTTSQLVIDYLISLGYAASKIKVNQTWDYVTTDAPKSLLDKGLIIEEEKKK